MRNAIGLILDEKWPPREILIAAAALRVLVLISAANFF